jgi:hypothetical protein
MPSTRAQNWRSCSTDSVERHLTRIAIEDVMTASYRHMVATR